MEDGDIRLLGGVSDREGRVEVCLNQQWGTVCDQLWSNSDAQVVCRQLSLNPIGEPASILAFRDKLQWTHITDHRDCSMIKWPENTKEGWIFVDL